MTAKQYIFLILTGFVFFGIALLDLYLHAWNQTYNWFSYMSWYGKMSVVCFAIILAVLMISPFIGKKRKTNK